MLLSVMTCSLIGNTFVHDFASPIRCKQQAYHRTASERQQGVSRRCQWEVVVDIRGLLQTGRHSPYKALLDLCRASFHRPSKQRCCSVRPHRIAEQDKSLVTEVGPALEQPIALSQFSHSMHDTCMMLTGTDCMRA
jgi:hypothetical protein